MARISCKIQKMRFALLETNIDSLILVHLILTGICLVLGDWKVIMFQACSLGLQVMNI